MRKLLLLALLLYDVVALATRSGNYDYDDIDGSKRHSFDDRRNWRKKGLMKPQEMDHKDWEDRRKHDYDSQGYIDELDRDKRFGSERRDPDSKYNKRFDEVDKINMALGIKSSENSHSNYMDKDTDKKNIALNCDRPHERFEACFAGCASVTCDNPRDRLRPCYPFCEQGCVCVHPYVRDDRTHKCVLPDECTRGLKGIPDLGDEA